MQKISGENNSENTQYRNNIFRNNLIDSSECYWTITFVKRLLQCPFSIKKACKREQCIKISERNFNKTKQKT